MTGRDQSIADVAQAKGEANPFYAPFKQMPATLPADVQAQLRLQAVKAIDTQVVPAYAKLLDFIRNEYQPRARPTLAAEALPDGQAYYRAQIREFTTLDFEPRSNPSDRLAGSGQAAHPDGPDHRLQRLQAAGRAGGFSRVSALPAY